MTPTPSAAHGYPTRIPVESTETIQATRDWLNGGARLADLRRRLSAAAGEAAPDADAAKALSGRIQLKLIREDDPAEKRRLAAELDETEARLSAAMQEAERLPRLSAALPDDIRAHEDGIGDVSASFNADVVVPVVQTALAANVADITAAMAPLVEALERAYALQAAGIGIYGLADIAVPDFASHGHHLLRGGFLKLADGSYKDLRQSWRDNPTAAALFELYGPVHDVRRQLEVERQRIEKRRANELYRANVAARETGARRLPLTRSHEEAVAENDRAYHEALSSRPKFVPSVYRSPGTPAPARNDGEQTLAGAQST